MTLTLNSTLPPAMLQPLTPLLGDRLLRAPPLRCYREESDTRYRRDWLRFRDAEGWNRITTGMSAAEGRPRCRWGGGEAVLRARAEAAGYRRLLRARAAEVEALRGAVGALHRQLEGLRDRRSGELAKYQERVAELEREIGAAEAEMARCLREYPALLRLRMALEAEIAAYREMLESEELRLGGLTPP
ncbi:alpha-internexin-like isoform X2 [Camarhynchus parvulus]|uniref:alpha-internexin-like isoform X2 n=1 Tax=Geospiza parvula TaxID=87175 RepID=UPI001237D9AF|nr:alpha-internexin-like isoform X2 [Camarhynchus parvulus]